MQETEPKPDPFVIDAGEVAGQLSKVLWDALHVKQRLHVASEENQRRNAIAKRRKANRAAKQARKRSK